MGTVAKKIMMGSGAVALPSDSEFNRTSFLSHFDGTNNGVNNQFTDGSASNHTITANGDVTQGSFNPYGTNWAVDFSKDANPRLSCGSSSDFTFGTGDFTVEFFVFFYSLTSYQTPMSAGYSNDSGGMFIQTGNGDGKFKFRSGGSALVSETTSDAVANKWYHIAFSQQSGTLRVYRNGVQTGTASNSTNLNRTGNILIGSDQDFNIDGLLSNFRLVKGTSLYNSNFTAPTSPLTAVTNTKLLTLQSNRFVDNSASGHTVTPNTGKETVTAFGPFLSSAVYDPAVNGASAYFDGNGDYLTISASADFNFGTGDATLECWIYPASSVGILFATGNASSSDQFGIFNSSEGLWWGQTSSNSSRPSGKQWAHVAVSREGNTIRRYINGVQASTGTNTGSIGSSSATAYVGRRPSGGNLFGGYIADLRVVKGTAVYTGASAFTPPTAPLTAVTNTKLLLNMADGQAIDSAAQNNLTLYGTAKTSTAQKKFGTASLLLDGNSDYAKTSGYVGSIYGGKTIECWVYASSISSKMCIWEWYEDDDNLLRLFFEGGNGNVLRLDQRNGGSTIVGTTGATTLSATTWYHLAATRTAAGAWKVYINGTADTDLSGSESGTTLDITDIPLYLGVDFWATDRYWNGHIDDFRVSELDRYASGNFTAPTEPFADKGQ